MPVPIVPLTDSFNLGEKSVSVEASAKIPLPVAPGISVGPTVGVDWGSNAQIAFASKGSKLEDPKRYTTLLTLRAMTPAWKAFFFGDGMRGDDSNRPKVAPDPENM